MKIISKLLFISFFLFSKSLFADDYISLSDCIKNKTVETNIKVYNEGTHYTIQFILNVKNLKTKSQNIVVDAGLLFIADDDPKQNFIITKEERFVLAANGSKEIQIHAMCIESSDAAPSATSIYKVGKMAEGKLLELAQLLNTNKWYDKSEAQDAVWCVANGNDISDIMGADDTVVKKLQEFVSKATGQAIPVAEALDDYEHNYYSTKFTRKVGGYFEYTLSKPTIVTIGMFDKNNILVRELYNNQNETVGFHKFDFAFDATVYTDDAYYFKLIENGIVKLDMEFKLKN